MFLLLSSVIADRSIHSIKEAVEDRLQARGADHDVTIVLLQAIASSRQSWIILRQFQNSSDEHPTSTGKHHRIMKRTISIMTLDLRTCPTLLLQVQYKYMIIKGT